MDVQAETDVPRRNGRRAVLLRILGIVIAVAAITLCVRALVEQWAEVSAALRTADLRWIAAGIASAAIGMWFLALLWQQCLRVFGTRTPLGRTTAWFFAGELGKYLPGGIWPVVGRGEMAHRGGVKRSLAYTTTLMSLGLMCVGGAVTCVMLLPFLSGGGLRFGWELLILLLIPIGVVAVHPAVLGRLLAMVGRLSKGRVVVAAPRWAPMVGLIALSTPAWLFVGASSSMITEALGFEQQPARVAFAAVAAWIVGFVVVPVPAGAGVREIMFVMLSGLAPGPAVAVAALSRLGYVAIDATIGIVSVLVLRATRASTSGERSVVVGNQ